MSNILRIPPRRTPSTTTLDVPQIMTINPSSEPDMEEEYATEEEEIDEIIDDDDPPPPAPVPARNVKPNGKGKAKAKTPYNLTPPAEPPMPKPEPLIPPLPARKPGETYIDQQRVEKIIKAHGDMLPPSKDAVFLIALAAEAFVKQLAATGFQHAVEEDRKVVNHRDMALAAEIDRGYSFLRETVPTTIPLSVALQKHTQKENERMLIATAELVQTSGVLGNGTTAHSHKKRQSAAPKPPAPAKAKTRTSARQANGRSSSGAASAASSWASSHVTFVPRPKRAAAQKSRGSWAEEDDDIPDYEDEESNYVPPPPPPLQAQDSMAMDVDTNGSHWKSPPPVRQGFGNVGPGRGGIMKGFGPGAYGKVGALALGGSGSPRSATSPGVGAPTSPQRSRGSWGFPPEPPRNTGRTIYSDRNDEEARKAAVEAEEEARYKRARQKIEEELHMDQDVPPPERTEDGE